MKLYPIIFEAAKTTTEAISKGIAAIWIRKEAHDVQSGGRVGLLSKNKFINAFKKLLKQKKNNKALLSQGDFNKDESFIDSFVGSVLYSRVKGTTMPLFKVETSAGVDKYGVLAYQLAMFAMTRHESDAWVRSDNSLTEDSQGVWNEMYSRPEYSKKWIGEFYPKDNRVGVIEKLTGVNSAVRRQLFPYFHQVIGSKSGKLFSGEENRPVSAEEATSEEFFLKYLAAKKLNPEDFGHFWACQMTSFPTDVIEAFEGSTDLYRTVEDLRARANVPFNKVSKVMGQEDGDEEKDPYALVSPDYKPSVSYTTKIETTDISPADFDEIIDRVGSGFFIKHYY